MFRLSLLAILFLGLTVVILSYEMDSLSLQERYDRERFNISKKICLQTSEYGKCKGRRKMWYYNVNKFKCQKFTYSNCGGNGNLFYTNESCTNFCNYNWKTGHKIGHQSKDAAKSKAAKSSKDQKKI
ncbi:kunitz-type serine protease inhibitor B6 [Drosophila eugracilis]|uniref:kunitz-type serine protease inhibitor B6 n=1 Tax=Drosophila eugracilis TaxID=29029 RepID=UPI0007E7423A|nr:kunitz-type serine protease inhibitor B6 [Drosophila eugracilis]